MVPKWRTQEVNQDYSEPKACSFSILPCLGMAERSRKAILSIRERHVQSSEEGESWAVSTRSRCVGGAEGSCPKKNPPMEMAGQAEQVLCTGGRGSRDPALGGTDVPRWSWSVQEAGEPPRS